MTSSMSVNPDVHAYAPLDAMIIAPVIVSSCYWPAPDVLITLLASSSLACVCPFTSATAYYVYQLALNRVWVCNVGVSRRAHTPWMDEWMQTRMLAVSGHDARVSVCRGVDSNAAGLLACSRAHAQSHRNVSRRAHSKTDAIIVSGRACNI